MANFQANKLPVSNVTGVNDNPLVDSAQGVNGTKMIISFNNAIDAIQNEFNGLILIERLSANRTYYVSTTGSDNSNNGLSVGTPFQTINKALSVVSQIDFNNYSVTIQLADGTYNEEISLPSLMRGVSWNNSNNSYVNQLIINGNATTIGNVIIQAPYVDGNVLGTFVFQNLKIIRNQYGGSYATSKNGRLIFKNIEIDLSNTDIAFLVYRGGFIELGDNLATPTTIKFTGTFDKAIDVYDFSHLIVNPSTTIVFNSAAFSTTFIDVNSLSLVNIMYDVLFTNTFTGKSFNRNSTNNGTLINDSATSLDSLGTVNGTTN